METTKTTTSGTDILVTSEGLPTSNVKLSGNEQATRTDNGLIQLLDQKSILSKQIPIIYREENNITFLGLEKLHPFDPQKYRNIAAFLVKEKVVKDYSHFIKQKQVSEDQLKDFHTEEYLKSLEYSSTLARITEFPPFAYIPHFLLKWRFLNPMWYQVGATILGGELALRYGWSVCLSGGMHHSSSNDGGGWCVYSDVPIAIKHLKKQNKITKAMIIDTDAHQGNGHERDHIDNKMGNYKDIYIMDCYNKQIYPQDHHAKKGIDLEVTYSLHVTDKEYLSKLDNGLKRAFSSFQPDIIFYNAGTDVLDGDPLGHMGVSPNGVITRDENVWEYAVKNSIPIVMVLSGGYQLNNARVIADSIKNLMTKFQLETLAQSNFKKNLL